MAVALSPGDLTIEPRSEPNEHLGSPKLSTSKRHSRRTKSGQKPTSSPKSPKQKSPVSKSQESTDALDLGILAMDIGKAIGDFISTSMCSSISQFTQDMMAVLQNRADSLPDMGGQKQQAPHQEDKQKDVSADEADAVQPNPEISGEKEVPSGSYATENTDENEARPTSRKKMSPTVGSEPAAKKKKMIVPTHADSDMSEVEEDGKDTDSVVESDEWSPSQETDSFVELVFRMILTKAQREKLLKDYPKPSTDAARVPVLDSSIRAVYYQMQPADSQLYKVQRVVLDAANPLIKAFDLLQQEPDSLDIAEVSKAVKSSLQLLGGANAHLTTERRKGVLSKMKPQWAHLAKEKIPEAKHNLFGEGFEEVVEIRAKAITALKKATTLSGSSSSQQNFRSSAQPYRPF